MPHDLLGFAAKPDDPRVIRVAELLGGLQVSSYTFLFATFPLSLCIQKKKKKPPIIRPCKSETLGKKV